MQALDCFREQFTKKPENTSDIPLDGMAFQVGYTETRNTETNPKQLPSGIVPGRGAVKAPV